MADPRISVVVLTHERPVELERTLGALAALPEEPEVIVADNGRSDLTAQVVRSFPRARLVRTGGNRGAAGRNDGVAEVHTPFVAFCDDDTYWTHGALARAADVLQQHPALGAIAARVQVGPDGPVDPTCERMADDVLAAGDLPGPELVSFMAGAVVMRTEAFRAAGGYEEKLFLGGEELLLALDLAVRGWRIAYVPSVATVHEPSTRREPARARRRTTWRNRLWVAWLRLPWPMARIVTRTVLREARTDRSALRVAASALAGLGWVLRHRRTVPAAVARKWWRAFGVGPPCSAPVGQHAPRNVDCPGSMTSTSLPICHAANPPPAHRADQ